MLCDDRDEVERRLAAVSVWHEPMVSATDFAAALGLAAGSVRQYVSKDARFPAPARVGRRGTNLWTLAQVYDHCDSSATSQRACGGIPRVYPLSRSTPTSSGGARHLVAARFEAAECVPAIYRYLEPPLRARPDRVPVVHYWTPGDGRETLAVVYLAGDAGLDRWAARDLAASAARFLHARDITSTAVVITDEDDRPVPNSTSESQRTVIVAEVARPIWLPWNAVAQPTPPSGRSRRPSELDLAADPPVSVYDVGLYDLRYLLRRDLPSWPIGGRDAREIADWKLAAHRYP